MYPLPLPLGPVYVHFTVSRQHLLEAFPLRAAFPLFLFYNQKVSFFGTFKKISPAFVFLATIKQKFGSGK